MDTPELVVPDVAAWRAWLDAPENEEARVWLRLAKKGTTDPTSLTYQEAMREALCSGWIDGQRRGYDDATFQQRYTPRRPRSIWSSRNVGIIAELEAEGRLRPRGLAEVEKAKADGRWENAYAGQASVEVPTELVQALAEDPAASAVFEGLSRSERYSILHPIVSVGPEKRESRVAKAMTVLRSAAQKQES